MLHASLDIVGNVGSVGLLFDDAMWAYVLLTLGSAAITMTLVVSILFENGISPSSMNI